MTFIGRFFVGEAENLPDIDWQVIPPDSAFISSSDYMGTLTVDSEKRRIERLGPDTPQGFASKYIHSGAGARIARFQTNSERVRITVEFTGLVTRLSPTNATAFVLADGVQVGSITGSPGAISTQSTDVVLGSAVSRLIEVVCPMIEAIDFKMAEIVGGATVSSAPTRPSTRTLVLGDSIAHGSFATSSILAWPYLMANIETSEVCNLGFGGSTAQNWALLGASFLDGENADNVWVALGYNDFAQQRALASYENDLGAILSAARSGFPLATIYVASMIYTNSPAANDPTNFPIRPSDYRLSAQNAVTTFADSNTTFVDGLTLMTNSSSVLASDGIHPIDTGHQEVAASAANLIT